MSQTENTVTDAPTMEKSVNEEIHEQFIEVVQTLSTFKSTITYSPLKLRFWKEM